MAHTVYAYSLLDTLAENLLRLYGDAEEVLTGNAPLDIEHLAEIFLEAEFDFQYLTLNGSTLAMTALSDGLIEVWNNERSAQHFMHTVAGTIILERDQDLVGCSQRLRFTMAHECGHLILHQPLEESPSPEALARVMKFDPSFSERSIDTRRDEDFRESQANRLGAALLMPKCGVEALVNEYEEQDPPDLPEGVITLQELIAKRFDVSYEAAQIRYRCLFPVASD